jgi:hypothetical protein
MTTNGAFTCQQPGPTLPASRECPAPFGGVGAAV